MTVWSVKEVPEVEAVVLCQTISFTQSREPTRLITNPALLRVFCDKKIFAEKHFSPLAIALTEVTALTPTELAALGFATEGDRGAFLLLTFETRELTVNDLAIPIGSTNGLEIRHYSRYCYWSEVAAAILAEGGLLDIGLDRQERQWHHKRLKARRVFRWLKRRIRGLGLRNCKLALDAVRSIGFSSQHHFATRITPVPLQVTPEHAAELGVHANSECVFLVVYLVRMKDPEIKPPLWFDLVTDNTATIPLTLPLEAEIAGITKLSPCYLIYDAYLVSDQPLSVAN